MTVRAIPGFKFGSIPELVLSSYLGGEYLGRVPTISGSWEVSDEADVTVPGAFKVSVPAEIPPALAVEYGGRLSWVPVSAGDPLATWGQELHVQVLVAGELVTLGWFRITRAPLVGPVVQVEGRGLLRNLERARLTHPLTVFEITRQAMVQELTRGVLPVAFEVADSPPLAVRTWERERLDGFWDVVRTWPARAFVDESRTLVVAPPWSESEPPDGDPITDGPGGGLINAGGQDDDRDPFNAYVVTSEPDAGSDDPPVADWWPMEYGPGRWGGPFGWNPGFYSSPLLPTDRGTLRQVAKDMTERNLRAALSIDFEHVFDPRLEVGDVREFRSARHNIDGVGRIMQLTHTWARTKGKVALR